MFVDYIDTNYTLYNDIVVKGLKGTHSCEVVANNVIGAPDTLYSLRAGDIKMPVE